MNKNRLLGAYYFRAGMFTLVPDHTRAQLDDMCRMETDIVCLAVNRQDCNYNRPNLEFLVEEIHKREMKVFFVPSTVAGITAGAPLTADPLGYKFPNTWAQNKDGSHIIRSAGAMCSFYYPEVQEHFWEVVDVMMQRFGPDGIIWDEPKSTNWQDFSPKALEENPEGDWLIYLRDYTRFFSLLNKRIKAAYPKLLIAHFDEACRWDAVVDATAQIEHTDYVGTDGHPWCPERKVVADNQTYQKTIPHYGERYLLAARRNGRSTLALIENQRLTTSRSIQMKEELDSVLNMDIDLLLYYYYGFNQPESEANMELFRARLPKWRLDR